MSEIFKKTIERLPELLAKNAPSMMERMIAAMQTSLAIDPKRENSAYCALLLKMSSADLTRAFDAEVREAMGAFNGEDGKPRLDSSEFGLSLESFDAKANHDDDFASSAAAFLGLSAKASQLGVSSLGHYSKDVFLSCAKAAFSKSRIEPGDVDKLLPHARKALNEELLKLYEKLRAL